MAGPPIVDRPGALSAVGVGKEPAFGVWVAPTSFQPATSCTIEQDPGLFYPQVMQGVLETNVYPLYGQFKCAGDIAGPLFPTNGVPILVAAIGTDSVTGTAAPYTHTVNPASILNSLTVEKNVGGYESLQFAGCRVSKYSVKCQTTNTEASFTASVMGQQARVVPSPTAISVTNESPFIFSEATLSYYNTVVQGNNLTCDITNTLKDNWILNGSHYLAYLTMVARHCSGSFDVIWDSFDGATYGYWNKIFDGVGTSPPGSYGALSLAFVHPGTAGSITLNLPKVRLAKLATNLKLGDVVMDTLTYEADYDLGGTNRTMQAVITNQTATQY